MPFKNNVQTASEMIGVIMYIGNTCAIYQESRKFLIVPCSFCIYEISKGEMNQICPFQKHHLDGNMTVSFRPIVTLLVQKKVMQASFGVILAQLVGNGHT